MVALTRVRGVELLERLLEHDAAVAVVAGAAIEPQEPHRHASRSSPCTAARRVRRAEGNRHARSRVREGNPTRRPPRARLARPRGHAFTGPAQQTLVPEVGLEPTRPFRHPILSRARLPVPPHRHGVGEQRFYTAARRSVTTPARTGRGSASAPANASVQLSFWGPRAARCSAADQGQTAAAHRKWNCPGETVKLAQSARPQDPREETSPCPPTSPATATTSAARAPS